MLRAGEGWPEHRLPSWVHRQLERNGVCIVGCPLADDGVAEAVASVVEPGNGGYRNIANLLGQPQEESLRSARRLTATEQPLKAAIARRLVALGLQRGRKNVMAEHPTEVTDGITAVRAWPDCPQQYDHCDRAAEGSLQKKPLSQVSLVALLALEEDTRLVVNHREVSLAPGEMIIFRGDLCHAGAGYVRCNTRLHVYLDPLGSRMSTQLHGCVA